MDQLSEHDFYETEMPAGYNKAFIPVSLVVEYRPQIFHTAYIWNIFISNNARKFASFLLVRETRICSCFYGYAGRSIKLFQKDSQNI